MYYKHLLFEKNNDLNQIHLFCLVSLFQVIFHNLNQVLDISRYPIHCWKVYHKIYLRELVDKRSENFEMKSITSASMQTSNIQGMTCGTCTFYQMLTFYTHSKSGWSRFHMKWLLKHAWMSELSFLNNSRCVSELMTKIKPLVHVYISLWCYRAVFVKQFQGHIGA